MARISLIGADMATIANLGQLYQYDFAELVDAAVGPDGRYAFIPMDTYAAPKHHRFLIDVEGATAGFAICSQGEAFRDPAETAWWMDEFFVMRPYRRRGVGERAATLLFDRFKGVWEVGQLRPNTPAQSFWRNIIGRYTGGNYEEIDMTDQRWDGPVQYFSS